MGLQSEKTATEWLNKNVSAFKESPLKLNWNNQYESWDVYNNEIIGELKHRHMPYLRWAEQGYILEKYKFDKLVKHSKSREDGAKILYINTFDDEDSTLVWWNLSTLIEEKYDFNWHNKSMKKTTYFENNSQVDKLVCLLSDKIVHYKIKRKDA